MNDLTPHTQGADLPSLIDHAARALSSARDSAEVLEARDLARVAYDATKTAGRMARAKGAHDDIIAAVYRAQADALLIEARAKSRLADEYDAAQKRGEVATGDRSRDFGVGEHNAKPATAADLGLRRDEIHEARQIRDAERDHPGVIENTLSDIVASMDEPTKARLRRGIVEAARQSGRGDGRKNPHQVKNTMTDRVFKFSGLCRSLAEFSDVEQIAEWDAIPQTAEKLPAEVREAMHILSRFMETQDA